MEKDEIRLGDLHRMFIGNAPWEFLIEIFIRTVFIYCIFYLLVKWLGKRMNGQLTLTEMVVMLSLGGIIAVPMQTPDRGLLQGIIVIVCAFVFQRGISLLGFYSGRMEKIIQGRAKLLVKDGRLCLGEMRSARITHYQLFAKLRKQEIHHLGKVKRVYLEAEGLFSIFEEEEEKPGLSTLPEEDADILTRQKSAKGKMACHNCGNVVDTDVASETSTSCKVCGRTKWVPAVME